MRKNKQAEFVRGCLRENILFLFRRSADRVPALDEIILSAIEAIELEPWIEKSNGDVAQLVAAAIRAEYDRIQPHGWRFFEGMTTPGMYRHSFGFIDDYNGVAAYEAHETSVVALAAQSRVVYRQLEDK